MVISEAGAGWGCEVCGRLGGVWWRCGPASCHSLLLTLSPARDVNATVWSETAASQHNTDQRNYHTKPSQLTSCSQLNLFQPSQLRKQKTLCHLRLLVMILSSICVLSSQYYHSHSEALYNHSTEYDLDYNQDIPVSEKEKWKVWKQQSDISIFIYHFCHKTAKVDKRKRP